jgi:hypothetical protein
LFPKCVGNPGKLPEPSHDMGNPNMMANLKTLNGFDLWNSLNSLELWNSLSQNGYGKGLNIIGISNF